MKELRRKAPEDEMLVVHKPGTRPEPDKLGRDRGVIARTPDLDKGDLELMRRKLSPVKVKWNMEAPVRSARSAALTLTRWPWGLSSSR